MMTCAPGSPTEEIARMHEIEPQNRQPEPNEPEGSRQGQAQEGGQRRGLLRRTRRGVAKPEVPEFRSGETDAKPGAAQGAESGDGGSAAPSGAGGSQPAAGGQRSGGRGT